MKKAVSSIIVLAFIALLFIGPPNMTAEANTSDWELTFEDNFDGDTLDTEIWSYDIGNGFYEPDGTFVPGWGNQELQSYQEDNVRVENGQLIIEAKDQEVSDDKGTYNYTSGKIHTKGNFSQTYGRFEARMSLPEGQGFWPAFWMMPEDDVYGTWAASGEIDIMENAGATPNKVGGAIHYGSQWPNNRYTARDYHFEDGFDTTDMNTYAVEWEPGEIRWYVNDVLYQTLNNWTAKDRDEATKFSYPAPFDQDFYMILNLAVGGWYGGAPDESTVFPNQVKVDYVKAYKKASYDAPAEPSFEAEELPADAKVAVDGNYVYDTDYTEGFTTLQTNDDVANNWDTTYWNFLKLDEFGGDGSISTETINDDTFAKVDITNGGSQTYSLQLIQNVTIGKGRYYKLSFDAKADANRPMNVKIGGGADRGWTAYSSSEDFSLTTDVQSYDMVFQMQHETDPLARLEFNVGSNAQGVSIGNVVLEEIDPVDPYNENDPKQPLPDGNYIYNGTFDQGAMDRLTYWNIAAPSADANAYVPESTRAFTAEITDGGDSIDALTLAQTGLQFTPTDEYQLTFNAKAASTRNIEVGFVSADGSTVYAKETVALTDAVETKTITLTMTDVEDLNGQLVFFLGGNDADVMLDDVELIRLTNNNTSLTLEERFPLRNGRFNQGLEYFGVHNQGEHEAASVATLGVEDGAFVADIENTGWEPWHLMLMQNAMTLKAGETYTVSFDAKSTVERNIDVSVENSSYHRYFSDIVTLTEEMQTFNYTFDMPQEDTVDLKFLLGAIEGVVDLPAHQVTIDNIVLEVAGSSEAAFLLENADFSQDFEGWVTHFQGQYDGPSEAAFSVEDEMAKISINNVGVNPWDISLSQEGKAVTADQTYIVSFDAYASTARDIEAVIDNGAPSYTRFLNKKVTLTEEVQNYSFEVTMPQDDVVGLKFLVGALEGAPSEAHDIFIDNVRFELAGVRDYLYGAEVNTPDEGEEESTETPDEGEEEQDNDTSDEDEESDNNSDVNEDTFVANDKAIEAVQNNQAFEVEITDEKVTKVMISKKQLDILKDKGAAVVVKKAGIQMTMPTSNLNGDITFDVAPSNEEGLTNQSDALSDVYSFNVSENGVAKTSFDTPVTLRFKVKDTDADTSTLKVYYFNPETKAWELVGGEFADGEVVVDVDHFSTYAVFSTDTFALADTPEDSEGSVDTPTDESTEETNDEPTATEEETNTDSEAVSDSDPSETDESGDRLPETATNLYLFMLVGIMMLLMGGTTLIFKDRRVRN